MDLFSFTSRGRTTTAPLLAKLLLLALLTVLIGTACGSADDSLVSSVTSASGGNTPAADELDTNDDESTPIATTAPVAAVVTEEDDSGSPDESTATETEPAEPTADQTADSNGDADQSNASGSAAVNLGTLARNFGANDTTCRSTIFASGTSTPEDLFAAGECAIVEISSERPVVLDLALITTEGDPLYYRYAYDGDKILHVIDTRLDAFGAREISAQLCDSIEAGRLVPTVTGCMPTTSLGIAEADG